MGERIQITHGRSITTCGTVGALAAATLGRYMILCDRFQAGAHVSGFTADVSIYDLRLGNHSTKLGGLHTVPALNVRRHAISEAQSR